MHRKYTGSKQRRNESESLTNNKNSPIQSAQANTSAQRRTSSRINMQINNNTAEKRSNEIEEQNEKIKKKKNN